MDRRKSLKAIAFTTVAAGMLTEACNPETNGTDAKNSDSAKPAAQTLDRFPEEQAHEDAIKAMPTFFTTDEMATIVVLADIIIPKDDVSGSASDAKVGDFIEFIVKDKPDFQVPMRGGLRWVDMYCLNKYNKQFKDCSSQQQIELVDQIAYPKKAKPEMSQGVSFFSLMRNLTATGFYTTKMGFDDIGYVGNRPNQWNGVPDDVLKQYGLAYNEKELQECVSFDKA